MFDGFANEKINNVLSSSHRFTVSLLQPQPFIDRIKVAMCRIGEQGLIMSRVNESIGIGMTPYRMKKIEYRSMRSGEFFIEPTPHYEELFIKSDEYEYQHEARICLTNELMGGIFDRYSLKIEKFRVEDYRKCYASIYVEVVADITRASSI